MFVKLAILLGLCQAICLSYGGVLRRSTEEKVCSPIYMECEKTEDCCPGYLICHPNSKRCSPVSDPVGPPPGQIGKLIVPPSSPGCGLISDSCNKTLDCCAPYVCDHTHKCVEESFVPPGGYGGYGGYGNGPAGIPGGNGYFHPGR